MSDINYITMNHKERDALILNSIGLKSITASGAVNKSFISNSEWNNIGSGINDAILTAPGTLGSPNSIGVIDKTPVGSPNIHSWTVDSSYPTGAAALAGIVVGYDNVVNQIAGVALGGFHAYIQYNSDGHSCVVSGSYHWIKAGRAVIVAGTNNEADTNAQFSFTGNGRFHKLTQQFGTILNGQNNQSLNTGASILYGDTCTANGIGSVIVGGKDSVTDADYSHISGTGNAVDSTSPYADVLGLNNSVLAGGSSLVRGTGNGVQNPGGAVFGDYITVLGRGIGVGREVHHNQPGAIYISNNKLSQHGDNSSIRAHGALRTTNATATNMNLSIAPTSMLAVPDNTTWAVTSRVIATNEDTMAVNTWDVRADVKRINGVLSFVSAATITARAAEMALTLTMTVSSSAGLLRFNCTGLAATNIKWAATFDITETRGVWNDTFSANATTDELTLTTSAKALQPGEKVRLTTTGTLPAGLSTNTDYWVYLPAGPYYGQNLFKLATTPSGIGSNIVTTTPNGIAIKRNSTISTVVNITDAGTGTHTITRY